MTTSPYQTYTSLFTQSITPNQRELFWHKESKSLEWYTPPSLQNTLTSTTLPFYKWFSDGTLNICHNVLDQHIHKGHGSTKALVSHCAYSNSYIEYTYNDLFMKVNLMAQILKRNAISKGDIVIIYMPMIPESIIAMLACARLGAVHSVVFGGYAQGELTDRIVNAKPKMIITASVGIEPRKQIPYYPLVLNSIKRSGLSGVNVLLVQRRDVMEVSKEDIMAYTLGKVVVYNDEILTYEHNYKNALQSIDKFIVSELYIPPTPMNSNDCFYILYTSGTTGTPKGVIRDCASIVPVKYTMNNIMNVKQGDVVFSTGDIGWIVGHVFVVYGPLLQGATTIIMEGKPVGTPDAGKCWEVIAKYKVKAFYTAPTALRAMKKCDSDYTMMRKYDISSLESIHMAGERCDPETFKWIQQGVGEKTLINDQWWQTESGYPICCNNLGICRFTSKPGSALKPQPGFNVKIMNDTLTEELPRCKLGKICIELPMPPAFMVSLYGDDAAFVTKYISKDNKYYITGDCGYFDEEGDIFIMTRLDDMIKTAGHRLSTGRMEEVIMKVKGISEVAVVPVRDELKGELPFAFVVVNNEEEHRKKELVNEAKEIIVKEIGAISRLKNAVVCDRLPKTKSGKIVRSLLRDILNGKEGSVVAEHGVEDGEAVMKEIKEVLIKENIIK